VRVSPTSSPAKWASACTRYWDSSRSASTGSWSCRTRPRPDAFPPSEPGRRNSPLLAERRATPSDREPRAELLHVLLLPDLERAERIGEFWGYPQSRTFAELLIDCEEDRALRAALIDMLRDADR
jgi:hypothetical protein